MSGEEGKGRVSPEQLAQAYVLQLGALKSQIDELQSYIAQLEATIANLEAAKNSVKAVNSGSDDILVPGDPGGTVYMKVKPARTDAVLLHLGLNIYVYVSPDDAVKIIEERKSKYASVVERLRSELEKLVTQYRELERGLAVLQQRQQKR